MPGDKGKRAKRSKSSGRWLARQRKDPFARRAAEAGRVSRAHYKLVELDRRLGLLRPGMWILELGAAPGGWTHYLETRIGRGKLIVVDPRPVQAAAETVFVRGFYGEPAVLASIKKELGERRVDLVLSDMAPSITGVRATDQARALALAELALDAAARWLKPGGDFVVKMFQGEGFELIVADIRNKFAKYRTVKPKASRPESREVYAVGQQFLA